MPDVLALSADGYQAQAKWGVTIRNQILRPDPAARGVPKPSTYGLEPMFDRLTIRLLGRESATCWFFSIE